MHTAFLPMLTGNVGIVNVAPLTTTAMQALLDRSAGTVSAQSLTSIAYVSTAIIPLEPWSIPDMTEMDSQENSPAEESVVRIFCIESPIVAKVQAICEAGPRQISTDLRHNVSLEHREALLAALVSRLQLSRELEERGIHWQYGGLPTVTYDPDCKAFLGLHVDDVERQPLHLRHQSQHRISINLGPGERFFLYLDLTLQKISDLLKTYMRDERRPHVLAQQFMTTLPSYPVMRVRLPPGYGYMAPVENIIHDGSTNGANHSFLFTASVQGI